MIKWLQNAKTSSIFKNVGFISFLLILGQSIFTPSFKAYDDLNFKIIAFILVWFLWFLLGLFFIFTFRSMVYNYVSKDPNAVRNKDGTLDMRYKKNSYSYRKKNNLL